MSAPKVHIKTYGCQMNERDSAAAQAVLLRDGWRLAAGETDADLVIINTCSVREKAEEKALGKLRLLLHEREESGGRRPVIGVMGCMAQRLQGELPRLAPKVDFALGTGCISALPRIVRAAMAGGAPVLEFGLSDPPEFQPLAPQKQAVCAFVAALLGCSRRCSYCIVPDVRGPERSRAAADILKEVNTLAEAGVKEICLLGQSVMSYGRRGGDVWKGMPPSPRGYAEPFTRLLEAAAAVPGMRRIRFTSSHPSGCTEELADAFKNIPQIPPHIHIALQSGSDNMLGRMNRGYTVAEFRAAVGRLRAAAPELAVTTDVIAGFPGETESDFAATRAFMEEMEFDNAFIFKYSARPGTRAAQWPDDVPAEEKLRRNHILLQDQEARSMRINQRLLDRKEIVLVEGPSLRNPRRWAGRTGSNKQTVFEPAPGLKPGDETPVHIERVTAQTLYGRPAS